MDVIEFNPPADLTDEERGRLDPFNYPAGFIFKTSGVLLSDDEARALLDGVRKDLVRQGLLTPEEIERARAIAEGK